VLIDTFRGRRADTALHERIVALRRGGHSIAETARLAPCSVSLVKKIWAGTKAAKGLSDGGV